MAEILIYLIKNKTSLDVLKLYETPVNCLGVYRLLSKDDQLIILRLIYSKFPVQIIPSKMLLDLLLLNEIDNKYELFKEFQINLHEAFKNWYFHVY